MMRRRPLLRAAAVGGGAYVMGKRSAQRQAAGQEQEAAQDQRISDLEQQPARGQGQPATDGRPVTEQLNQLASLHQQGALTDAEFAAAKAKLLGT
jgi:Short C-terminal domain